MSDEALCSRCDDRPAVRVGRCWACYKAWRRARRQAERSIDQIIRYATREFERDQLAQRVRQASG